MNDPARNLVQTALVQDTVTGFLLAGIGCTMDDKKNFMVVDASTSLNAVVSVHILKAAHFAETKRSDIEACFTAFMEREDIGLLLINQHVADDIRPVIAAATAPSESGPAPVTVLEIPSKDAPYDPSRDPIMARVAQLMGQSVEGTDAQA